MRCEEIDYEIFGNGMQVVEVKLDPGETVIAEVGAMNWMDDRIIALRCPSGHGVAAVPSANPPGRPTRALEATPPPQAKDTGYKNRLSLLTRTTHHPIVIPPRHIQLKNHRMVVRIVLPELVVDIGVARIRPRTSPSAPQHRN